MSKTLKKNSKTKIIPPDGGWGWIIVLAYALNNLIMVPLIQGMGLIFKDVFTDLKIPITNMTIILSVNMSFGMSMGFIHGPLLKIFGYRKIAIFGSILFVGGIISTAFATQFTHFLISYGFLTSFGIGLTMASFSLALNSYFNEKRGRATAIAMTFTGLGPILMPQIISSFVSIYSYQGVIVILGALSLHTIAASLLLQPLKWHAQYSSPKLHKNENLNSYSEYQDNKGPIVLSNLTKVEAKNRASKIEEKSLDNREIQHNTIDSSIVEEPCLNVKKFSNHAKNKHQPYEWWQSGMSLESVNLGSSLMLFNESENALNKTLEFEEIPKIKGILKNPLNSDVEKQNHEKRQSILVNVNSKKTKCLIVTRLMRSAVHFFDLKLLSDPIYVNIMLGISIATFSEITFSVLTPFILKEIAFSTSQIAAVMSTIATVDLLMRGMSTFIGEWLDQPPRVMYLASLVMLIASRTTLIFCTGFIPALFMAVGLGIAKGFRAVYLSLVLPTYISIERLADATGLQTVVNGLLLLGLGPVVGIIRENRGNYVPCIILMNILTGLTITMWLIEMLVINNLNKRKKQQHYAVVADVQDS